MMATDDKISDAGRKERFEKWEKYGADRLRKDLEIDPLPRVGSQAVQDLAWEFVRLKEAEQAATLSKQPGEAVMLKPNFHGIGVDLKEIARRIKQRFMTQEREIRSIRGEIGRAVEIIWLSPAAWGLCLNMLGTGMAFFVGFPQPSDEEGVALGLEPGNVLDSGETVAQRDKRLRRRKALYYGASHFALALILVGFGLQLMDLLIRGQ